MQKDIRLYEEQEENPRYKTQAGSLFNKILKEMSEKVDYLFLSFDVDSISSFFMPGVSAPSVLGGLTNLEALEIMEIAGKNKKVCLVDFSEFNPAV